jgi:uncharacterized protein YoxC
MKLLLKEIVLVLAIVSAAVAQQSDYAVKKDFEDRYRTLAGRIDSATTIQELDSLKGAIVTLENDFAAHQAFLDKALYPTTLAESVAKLRSHEVLTYDRVYLIRTQGIRMSELEERIALITSRLDSLTTQRDQLFGELQENRKSLNALRDAVKRLSANLQAKDRLVFALADSIFLPYGKYLSQLADVHKEAVAQRIEKANVVTRVYEIAADNVRFLDLTKLQGKDFGNLIDQEQSFKSHWSGLKDNMVAVTATTGMLPASQPAKAASAKGAATKGTGRVEKDARRFGPCRVADQTEHHLLEHLAEGIHRRGNRRCAVQRRSFILRQHPHLCRDAEGEQSGSRPLHGFRVAGQDRQGLARGPQQRQYARQGRIRIARQARQRTEPRDR